MPKTGRKKVLWAFILPHDCQSPNLLEMHEQNGKMSVFNHFLKPIVFRVYVVFLRRKKTHTPYHFEIPPSSPSNPGLYLSFRFAQEVQRQHRHAGQGSLGTGTTWGVGEKRLLEISFGGPTASVCVVPNDYHDNLQKLKETLV